MKKNPILFILYMLRTLLLFVWVIFSTLFYGFICLLFGTFVEKIAYGISILWSKHLAFFCGVKVISHGAENIDPKKNYLYVSNHESYSDIVALFLGIPYRLSFIAKKSLFLIPFWGWAIYLIGHIPIDRSNPKKAKKSIEKACKKIQKEHRSIFGFPEGTRSRSGKMAPFKLGLFGMAITTGIDVVPIALRGTREVMTPGSFIIRPHPVYLDILPPISVKGYTQRNKNELAQKTWDAIHNHIEKEKKKIKTAVPE
ncbi:MAG: 1-acyl-sn-glycerol-3-phosphate acyltransferase [Spirochaetales bacterium]|nr:1-acyl-sn-glycerol-3-phosphate acyltransferase [Spirochaetales bacterium]